MQALLYIFTGANLIEVYTLAYLRHSLPNFPEEGIRQDGLPDIYKKC